MITKVLAISPHTDDAEFGCGAFMSSMVERGAEVLHVLVSASEKTGRADVDTAIQEFMDSNKIIGAATKTDVLFEHRELQRHRQAVLDYFVKLKKEFEPDMVLIPCMGDTHQDHAAVAVEGFRAFKGCDILGYDILWNNIAFESQAFFVFGQAMLNNKIKALSQYKSQAGRHYFDPDVVRSAARMRGAQVGATYAEGFSNVRRFL